MFRRHSIGSSPTTKNHLNMNQTPKKSNYREWIKFMLSALIPLMIGVFTVVTTVLQQKLSDQQREQDKQDALLLREQSERQADNLRKETIFATYLDDISKLLLMENESQHLLHIRMKTLTSLRQLNQEQKQHVLLFLYESELIYRHAEKATSSLLKLSHADFNDVFFQETIENQCSFPRLYLPEVYLSNSSFLGCYIDRSTFSNAIMYGATFSRTLLIRTAFKSALLNKANFSYAKLNIIDFAGASLVESDFTGARLRQENMNFTNTNLTGAILSQEQINNLTVSNCIFPNGTWGPIDTKNLVVNGGFEQNCTTNGNNFLVGWNVSSHGEIQVFTYDRSDLTKNFGRCYFRVTSFYLPRKVVSASQMIILENFSLLISAGRARYHASADLQCFGSQYAIIELRFKDVKDLQSNSIYSSANDSVLRTEMTSIEMTGIIPLDIRGVLLFLTFIDHSNNTLSINENYCICDNIKFSISKT